VSRDVTAAFVEQLDAPSKQPVLFFEGEFKSGTVYLWTGMGEIDWDGKTWSGVGSLGNASNVREIGGIAASGITVSLADIDNAALPIILNEVESGAAGSVWYGFIDDSGAVVANPLQAFVGRLDVPSFEDSGSGSKVSITYENRLRDLLRARELRYTHGSQQRVYPGDLGFEYVPSLQEWNGKWGRT